MRRIIGSQNAIDRPLKENFTCEMKSCENEFSIRDSLERRRKLIFSSLIIIAFIINNCASLFSKNEQEISIDTNPTGAEIFVNGDLLGISPVKYLAKRGTKKILVTAKKEKYQSTEIELRKNWDTLFLLNGVFQGYIFFPAAIDFFSGKWQEYDPTSYIILLDKENQTEDQID